MTGRVGLSFLLTKVLIGGTLLTIDALPWLSYQPLRGKRGTLRLRAQKVP